MPSKKIKTPIEPGCVYHIYNRGNNYQDVFFQKSDYHLFLEKLNLYLKDYCSVYAFALIPNHYHLLLRINDDIAENSFSMQFSKLILSYTNKINWREKRNGSLFLSYFRRIKVEDEAYLKSLVYYTHYNPCKHDVVEDFRSYQFSSYKIFLSDKRTSLNRDEVLSWFGDRKEFVGYHNFLHNEGLIKKYIIEEDEGN